MSAFVIVRTGIYDQGVVGVCSTFDNAAEMVRSAAALENDSYHNFEVREFILDDKNIKRVNNKVAWWANEYDMVNYWLYNSKEPLIGLVKQEVTA